MNRPKKLQDPTEAAMSAIEEALRLDQPKDGTDTPVETEPRLPSTSENDLKLEMPRVEPAPVSPPPAPAAPAQQQPAPPRAAIAPDTSRVANDDRRDSSSLVQAFAVRPSSRPYWFAALASLAWLGGAAFVLLGRTARSATACPSPSPASASANGPCSRSRSARRSCSSSSWRRSIAAPRKCA